MTVLALFPCYFWRLLVIPDEDFAEIVHGLLHKTNTEKVAWELTKAGDFRLELPHSIIRMRYHHPLGESVYVQVTILRRPDCAPVGIWTIGIGEESWQLVEKLYRVVNKQVGGS